MKEMILCFLVIITTIHAEEMTSIVRARADSSVGVNSGISVDSGLGSNSCSDPENVAPLNTMLVLRRPLSNEDAYAWDQQVQWALDSARVLGVAPATGSRVGLASDETRDNMLLGLTYDMDIVKWQLENSKKTAQEVRDPAAAILTAHHTLAHAKSKNQVTIPCCCDPTLWWCLH